MFVPSAESLFSALGLNKAAAKRGDKVLIPVGLLKFLLQVALAAVEFDEERYLRANPDVAGAVERGEIESGHMHFVGFGYFEGRIGGGAQFDEQWYFERYPDVELAVQEGRIDSAQVHFETVGGGEGRCPSPEYEAVAEQWKRAIHG
jgi:hypothetical protein